MIGILYCPVNLHIDDAGMTKGKTWSSASVLSMQFAGVPNPEKGREHNNHIICLTPTVKKSHMQSQGKMFAKVVEDEVVPCGVGSEAYDCFSGSIETIIAPIGIVAADLPSKDILSLNTPRGGIL